MLYVVDIDTVRWFDMKTGEPKGSVQVPGVIRFNDLEVADDGTIYATQTGTPQDADQLEGLQDQRRRASRRRSSPAPR